MSEIDVSGNMKEWIADNTDRIENAEKDIVHFRDYPDFGKGFYLTSLQE